uniref:Uncharacterized protein n=1 Tax=Chromera velia CCMP2878 TaxID=1169474 RepID=A0A0G4H2H8_9ALVE|eukprot:Cvel_24385.t1-p1 / transcript=Cvel_24385.t1 / gene=Cvel_24385 / organism=Chromera_velia_CCMP2878 / gene_product=hypothetical protein / transcript_product=hypothetical protein / location=Cvel_scaffold2628:24882-25277(+) / protein_length=132 / sequence_SO=supercontig / SO=protein_coding / is_pseudo=false
MFIYNLITIAFVVIICSGVAIFFTINERCLSKMKRANTGVSAGAEESSAAKKEKIRVNLSKKVMTTAALALVMDTCWGGNAFLIVFTNRDALGDVKNTRLPQLEAALEIQYIDPILTESASRFVLSNATADS